MRGLVAPSPGGRTAGQEGSTSGRPKTGCGLGRPEDVDTAARSVLVPVVTKEQVSRRSFPVDVTVGPRRVLVDQPEVIGGVLGERLAVAPFPVVVVLESSGEAYSSPPMWSRYAA
jgi:hypothetical protein